jgi:hypothetical protein
MGLLYSVTRSGRMVEKYAAVSGGAMNTFIPSHVPAGKKPKKKFAAEPAQKPGGTLMALSPDDVRAIVDALSQLDWVQWVKGKMEEEEVGGEEQGEMPATAEGEQGPGDVLPPEGEGAPGPMAAPPPGAEADEGLGLGGGEAGAGPPPAMGAAGGEPPPGPPGEDSEKQKLKEYSAGGSIMGSNCAPGAGSQQGNMKPGEAGVIDKKYAAGSNPAVTGKGSGFRPSPGDYDRSKYSAAEANLTAQVLALQKELQVERYARINSDRRAVLEGMRQQLVFDTDEEMQFCSADVMDEPRFEKYAASLGSKCVRVPHGGLPTQFLNMPAEAPPPTASSPEKLPQRATEKYAKDLSDRAFRYCEARASKGEAVDYVEVLNRLHRGEALPA